MADVQASAGNKTGLSRSTGVGRCRRKRRCSRWWRMRRPRADRLQDAAAAPRYEKDMAGHPRAPGAFVNYSAASREHDGAPPAAVAQS